MPPHATSRATVWIVLPAYNEEAALPPLLGRIRAAMQRDGFDYHVLVVNDGSTDRTSGVARGHAATMPLTVLDHAVNRGLGAALATGLSAAAARADVNDVVVTMDADNTHPPELIATMVGRVRDGHDLVVASRFAAGGRQIGLRPHRRLLSRGAGLLMRTLFPVAGVTDYSCGYRAYDSDILRGAFARHGGALVAEQGFACFVDILLKLRAMRVRAAEVPLVLRYDLKPGASKMRVGRTIRRYLRLIARALVAPGTRPFRRLPTHVPREATAIQDTAA